MYTWILVILLCIGALRATDVCSPEDYPILPELSLDSKLSHVDILGGSSMLRLTALPPPSTVGKTVILCARRIVEVPDGVVLSPHDALAPTFCSACPGSGPATLLLSGVQEGGNLYQVWSEVQDGEGGGLSLNLSLRRCAAPLRFAFSRSYSAVTVASTPYGEDEEVPPRSVSLPPNTLLVTQSSIVTPTKYGIMLTPSFDTHVAPSLTNAGEWEDTIIALLSLFIRPSSIVWEGGSHIGSHTIPLSLMAHYVHAFEPHPETRLILSSNVALNSRPNVSIRPYALGDLSEDGFRISLGSGCSDVASGICATDGNTGGFSFAHQERNDSGEIAVVSFDALVERKEIPSICPSVIKTDLEGMDVRALLGATSTISRCRPVLYFEAFAPLRTNWPDVKAALPSYDCYYDTFRTIPSDHNIHYDSSQRSSHRKDIEGDWSIRTGAISFNYLCVHPNTAAYNIVGDHLDRLTPVVDPYTDAIYKGEDCSSISKQLIDENIFELIIGPGRWSIC